MRFFEHSPQQQQPQARLFQGKRTILPKIWINYQWCLKIPLILLKNCWQTAQKSSWSQLFSETKAICSQKSESFCRNFKKLNKFAKTASRRRQHAGFIGKNRVFRWIFQRILAFRVGLRGRGPEKRGILRGKAGFHWKWKKIKENLRKLKKIINFMIFSLKSEWIIIKRFSFLDFCRDFLGFSWFFSKSRCRSGPSSGFRGNQRPIIEKFNKTQ